MGRNRRDASKLAFDTVRETCPAVDSAFDDAKAIVKEQTGTLRQALIDAFERALNAEETVLDLKARIAELEHQLSMHE